MKDKTRLIALSDSPEMDGELVIFETNAPSKRLKELEKESCALFTEEAYDEIPNWSYTLEFEGCLCRYIDSEQHVTPYGTSEEWQQENYQNIKEFYYIDKLKPESIN